jgi:hypothetical protein
MALHVYFFFPCSLFPCKNGVAKRLVPFNVRKVFETQKIRKNRVSCPELKPK